MYSILSCRGSEQVYERVTMKCSERSRWNLYSYEELHTATNGFHEENKLGKGLFGTVYRGKTSDGVEIAVRKLKSMNSQAQLQFATEVEVSRRVKHKNLLGFKGFCVEADYPLIVYDFMPNLCLHSHLHGQFSQDSHLNWKRRMKIAIGIAQGLRYLHYGLTPLVIHREIKASNILLDHSYKPKIADFRFAAMIPENVSHVTARVKGTMGYLAPEYAMLGKISENCDVYSFGVLLFELITGRKPIERLPGGLIRTLTDWAKPLIIKGRFGDLVDPAFRGNYDEGQLKQAIHVASLCVQIDPKKRPTMDIVISLLRQYDRPKETLEGRENETIDKNEELQPLLQP